MIGFFVIVEMLSRNDKFEFLEIKKRYFYKNLNNFYFDLKFRKMKMSFNYLKLEVN